MASAYIAHLGRLVEENGQRDLITPCTGHNITASHPVKVLRRSLRISSESKNHRRNEIIVPVINEWFLKPDNYTEVANESSIVRRTELFRFSLTARPDERRPHHHSQDNLIGSGC